MPTPGAKPGSTIVPPAAVKQSVAEDLGSTFETKSRRAPARPAAPTRPPVAPPPPPAADAPGGDTPPGDTPPGGQPPAPGSSDASLFSQWAPHSPRPPVDVPPGGAPAGDLPPGDDNTPPVELRPAGDDLPPGDGKGPQESIADLRRKADTASREAAALRIQLEETKKGSPDIRALKAQLETAQRKLNETQLELGKLNVRKHPDFVRRFETPREQLKEKAKGLAKRLNIPNPDEIVALFGKPLKEQSEWFNKNQPDAKDAFMRMMTDYEVFAMEGDEFAASVAANSEQWQLRAAEENRQRQVNMQKQLQRKVVETATRLSQAGLYGFVPDDGESEAPEQIRTLMENAAQIVLGNSDDARIELMMKGATVERYEGKLQTMAQRIFELEEQVRQHNSSVPLTRGTDTGRRPPPPPPPGGKKEPLPDPAAQFDGATQRKQFRGGVPVG